MPEHILSLSYRNWQRLCIFKNNSGKKMGTFWACFMKMEAEEMKILDG